jgi:hypothetical protein
MHLVKGFHCCPNFLAQPIRREEKFGPISKLAIFEQKCKLSKRTNRQISLALLQKAILVFRVSKFDTRAGGTKYLSLLCSFDDCKTERLTNAEIR